MYQGHFLAEIAFCFILTLCIWHLEYEIADTVKLKFKGRCLKDFGFVLSDVKQKRIRVIQTQTGPIVFDN